ncbi:lasso RiPP family leader peptide-containing protein, partial [Streptomyces sp. NPDC002766]|uniref:lasso RiPP family leader peptide-containing protein n=1 Tax=Streptomyces sp. NPDC002766 TaxID=3154429 RepID=UPI00332937F7
MTENEGIYEPPALTEIGDFADLTMGLPNGNDDWFGLYACGPGRTGWLDCRRSRCGAFWTRGHPH